MDERISRLIGSNGALVVTEPVIMEVLAGATTSAREDDLRRFLLRFPLLPFQAPGDFDGAVRIYRRCRSAGITPRGMVDCLIAAVAWRTGATLLARDSDVTQIAGVMGIELDHG